MDIEQLSVQQVASILTLADRYEVNMSRMIHITTIKVFVMITIDVLTIKKLSIEITNGLVHLSSTHVDVKYQTQGCTLWVPISMSYKRKKNIKLKSKNGIFPVALPRSTGTHWIKDPLGLILCPHLK